MSKMYPFGFEPHEFQDWKDNYNCFFCGQPRKGDVHTDYEHASASSTDTELERIFSGLYRTYEPKHPNMREDELFLDEAKAQLKQLIARERLDELKLYLPIQDEVDFEMHMADREATLQEQKDKEII